MNLDFATKILFEHVDSESLRNHCLLVGKSMAWYADYFKVSAEEKVIWQCAGILHDFDYEKHPEPIAPDGHPFWGVNYLKQFEVSQDLLEAILGHANYSGVERKLLISKALYAVDEMSGFVYAASLVRPDKLIKNVEVKSILKKMKDKAFAKGCNREEMIQGAEELGIPLEEHISNIITALSAS